MIFIALTFIAAFLIEGLGTAVSVIGLSTLFGANPIIISLAIALDYGKLIVVSLLYKHWSKMGYVMKGYALVAAFVTMLITSAGAAGYLTGEFQKAILGTQETNLKVDVLKQQQAKYEERKKQIDGQIANLPEKTTVNQRIRLMKQFQDEQKALQAKIEEIDKQLPEMQMKQIGVEAKAGPILYISKAFDVPVEVAVKYVVLMIIFVFDPLAVFLIVAGNFLLDQRKRKKPKPPDDEDPEPGPPEPEPEVEPKVPNAETIAALEESRRIMEARQHAQNVREEQERVHDKMAATESFIPATPKFDEGFTDQLLDELELEPLEPQVEPEPAPVVPIVQREQVSPAPPVVAKPLVQPSQTAKKERAEIKLNDLKPPHRSTLNDVREQAAVYFDQDVRASTHSDFYSKQR